MMTMLYNRLVYTPYHNRVIISIERRPGSAGKRHCFSCESQLPLHGSCLNRKDDSLSGSCALHVAWFMLSPCASASTSHGVLPHTCGTALAATDEQAGHLSKARHKLEFVCYNYMNDRKNIEETHSNSKKT